MEWRIELIFVPVTDVDRAKSFYVDQVGFHADHAVERNPRIKVGFRDADASRLRSQLALRTDHVRPAAH